MIHAEQELEASKSAASTAAAAWIKALAMTAPIQANPGRIFPILLDELAERYGDAPALLSEAAVMSYKALAELSNRYGRWGLALGLRKGDSVCLLMPNCADYMAIWLGLSGIGCVVALINANLTGASLAHCIDAAEAKTVIVDGSLAQALMSAKDFLKNKPKVFCHGSSSDEFTSIEPAIAGLSGQPLGPNLRLDVTIKDPALYIYTSGTTGLPKAARVSHYRIMAWSHWFSGLMGITPSDRLYNCLPMYHSIGGVAAPGALLAGGGSVVIREKFSATRFWKDICEQDCTIFQYIGELCRYLINTPQSSYELSHRLRLCCGNGLSADVWQAFKARYKIPQILEFYAATEGTFSLYNVEGVPGSIGRVPSFLPQSAQVRLVKHDVDTDTVVRNADGLCIPCAADEVGEAIGRIAADGGARFEGYTTQADTEKKVLRDVFKAGDAWFRTGDLMVRDKKGLFYFVDRIGDTFRWKGENVSTSEVRDVIAAFAGVLDVTVYGVPVPGTEGRAGMAALVTGQVFDLAKLGAHLRERLPSYAQPLFLRLADKIEVTSTFKHKKTDLVRAGFDPRTITDKLFFRDPATETYVALDEGAFDSIAAGNVKI